MQVPISKKVVYVPRRGEKGVINITTWVPLDAEIANVARIVEETLLCAAPAKGEEEAPVAKKVVYVPKRRKKGVINMTTFAPLDAEIPNVARIVEETLLYTASVQGTDFS